MAGAAERSTISPVELFEVAEAVARSGRRRTVRLNGRTLAIVPQPVKHEGTGTSRRRKPLENAFLAASGVLPPLDPPRDINEMTEIAAEEAALAAAREGLDPDDDS